jgi:hypothetical protein
VASDTYTAVADSKLAMDIAEATSPFTIEVRFVGGLTKTQKKAFTKAADRWVTVIVGDLPSVVVDGELIDDVLILAEGADIDGPGQILGQAGPDRIRPQSAGKAAGLPARGTMQFDKADLKAMEQKGTLNDVITHEMGHVLGIGTLWRLKGLLKGAETNNPTFSGSAAIKEYKALRGEGGNKRVPVENTGGPGTRNGHWREAVFRHELMSGFIAAPDNPISRMTVASLKDLGYDVNPDAAEPYTLPDLMSLAEDGLLFARPPMEDGIVLPTIPMTLPDDSLR